MLHTETISPELLGLLTITQRGSKKDFIDLYFLLQRYTLAEIMG